MCITVCPSQLLHYYATYWLRARPRLVKLGVLTNIHSICEYTKPASYTH